MHELGLSGVGLFSTMLSQTIDLANRQDDTVVTIFKPIGKWIFLNPGQKLYFRNVHSAVATVNPDGKLNH